MSTGNTRYGNAALQSNTATNSNSSAFGVCALRDSTNLNNTAVGAYSGTFTTTGQSNVSLGTNSLLKNTTGSYNTALGTAAMCFNETGINNTAIGSNALENNISGPNTAVGARALFSNTNGIRNTAVGNLALQSNTTGNHNVAIGDSALQLNNLTSDNIAVGFQSLLNSTGPNNIGIGSYTLGKNTGDDNVAIGNATMTNKTSGNANIGVGSYSLQNTQSGAFNVGVGRYSLNSLTSSTSSNTAIGNEAGRIITTGANNTLLGHHSGYTVTTGGNNTLLGYEADVTVNTISNSTAIGYQAKANTSNQIMMGTIAEQVVIPGSAVLTNINPSSYSLTTSIVPKSYVDSMAIGLSPVDSCKCATTENINLSGLPVIDEYQTVEKDRVLVQKQSNAVDNGIYISATGAWSRAPECDVGKDVTGQVSFVENGHDYGFTSLNVILTDDSVSAKVGTDKIIYAKFYSSNFALDKGLEFANSALNIKKELSGFLNFVGINTGANTSYSLDTGTKDALINNVIVGRGKGNIQTNTVVGFEALQANSGGTGSNTAIGYQAGSSIATGANNTLLGCLADVTGNSINNSTAIGYNAKANTSNQIMMGTVSEQVYIPGTLHAIGNTILDSKLNVNGETTLNKLTVTGETTLDDDLIINNGKLFLNTGVNLTVNGGDLTVSGGALTVSGEGLTVTSGGLIVSAGGLTVSAGGLTVSAGNTTLANNLTVSTGGLTVSNGGLNITGETIINGNTATIKASTGSLNLQTGSNNGIIIDANGNVGIAGEINSSYKLNVNGPTNLTSTLAVTGATTLSSTLTVTGATTLNSKLNVTTGGLDVTGDTTLKNALTVSGATTLGPANSTSTMLTINGNTNIGGKLNAFSTASTPQGAFAYSNNRDDYNHGVIISSNDTKTEIKMNNTGSTHFTISNDSNFFKINKSSSSLNPFTMDANLMSLSNSGVLTLSNNIYMPNLTSIYGRNKTANTADEECFTPRDNNDSTLLKLRNGLWVYDITNTTVPLMIITPTSVTISNTLYIGKNNPGGGSGDNAYLEYVAPIANSETTVLRINVKNDVIGSASDNINLNPSGGVGIKTDAPAYELDVNGRLGVSGAMINTFSIPDGTKTTQVATTAFVYNCLVKKLYFTTGYILEAKYMYGNISIDLDMSADGSIGLQCPGYPNYMDGLVLRIRQTKSRRTITINTYNSSGATLTNAICNFNTYVPSTTSSLNVGSYYSYELIYMSTGNTTPAAGVVGCWYVTNVIN